MQNTARLAAKVRGKNRVNGIARLAAPAYLAALKPFVGQKIYKADGGFTKKFSDALPQGAMGDYWANSRYSLSRVFRVSEDVQGQSGCEYSEAAVYFGEINGGTLTSLHDFNPENFRTDYTVEDVLTARERVRKAQAELSAAQSACAPFGEYDR